MTALTLLQRAKVAAQLAAKTKELKSTLPQVIDGARGPTASPQAIAGEVAALTAQLFAPSITTAYELGRTDPKPTAAAVEAGEKHSRWHAPVPMADGRTLWSSNVVMLIGSTAPYPTMFVDRSITAGSKTQAEAGRSKRVIDTAKQRATTVVEIVYALDEATLALVGSGDVVVGVGRASLALAFSYCGPNAVIAIGAADDFVYVRSTDTKCEAVIAFVRVKHSAQDLKLDAERRVGRNRRPPSPRASVATLKPLPRKPVPPLVLDAAPQVAAFRCDPVDSGRDADGKAIQQASKLLEGMMVLASRMARTAEVQSAAMSQMMSNPRPIELTLRQESAPPSVVHVTMPVHPAPVVAITNQVHPAAVAVAVTATMPARKTETSVLRNSAGDIVKTTQLETDA